VSSRFQRFLLPGFAFKAVVIGGGYATGRELAEFFLPSGPWGGIAAMVLAMILWSAICVALIFFCCMIAFYSRIAAETLPSDYLLQRLNLPWFHLLFQLMIFAALLESGTGAVHAINERINRAWLHRHAQSLARAARLCIALAILTACMLLAQRFGLVTLIAKGYRAVAVIFLLVYVLPLFTLGLGRLRHRRTLAQETS
jgi:uncharacterized membrane protein YkvI